MRDKKESVFVQCFKTKNGWMNLDPLNFEMFLPGSFSFFVLAMRQKANKIEIKGRDLEIFFGAPCWWFRSMFVAPTLHINRRHEIDKQKKKKLFFWERIFSPVLFFFRVYSTLIGIRAWVIRLFFILPQVWNIQFGCTGLEVMYHNHCSPCFPSPVFIAWIIDPEEAEEKEEVKRTFYI